MLSNNWSTSLYVYEIAYGLVYSTKFGNSRSCSNNYGLSLGILKRHFLFVLVCDMLSSSLAKPKQFIGLESLDSLAHWLSLDQPRKTKLLEARDRQTERNGGWSRLKDIQPDYRNLDI